MGVFTCSTTDNPIVKAQLIHNQFNNKNGSIITNVNVPTAQNEEEGNQHQAGAALASSSQRSGVDQ